VHTRSSAIFISHLSLSLLRAHTLSLSQSLTLSLYHTCTNNHTIFSLFLSAEVYLSMSHSLSLPLSLSHTQTVFATAIEAMQPDKAPTGSVQNVGLVLVVKNCEICEAVLHSGSLLPSAEKVAHQVNAHEDTADDGKMVMSNGVRGVIHELVAAVTLHDDAGRQRVGGHAAGEAVQELVRRYNLSMERRQPHVATFAQLRVMGHNELIRTLHQRSRACQSTCRCRSQINVADALTGQQHCADQGRTVPTWSALRGYGCRTVCARKAAQNVVLDASRSCTHGSGGAMGRRHWNTVC